MAARRVAKSAVDWVAIADRVPARQKDAFRMFKTTSDKYVNKVAELPEALPKIDFAEYGKRISNPAMVAEFQKMYSALDVPYPKDSQNLKGNLQTEEKKALEGKNKYVAEQNIYIQSLKNVLGKMDSVPPPEDMTMQMYNYYFPDAQLNPNKENPGFWPQDDRRGQIDTMHLEGRTFYNHADDRRNLQSWEEFEEEWEQKVAAQEKAKQEKEKLSS